MNRTRELYEFAYGIDDDRGQLQPLKPQNINNSPIVTNPNKKDVSNSVGVTLNPPQGLLDIYNKQVKLANQQYANQQALAQRNAERDRQRLQEQLANQRMDYLRGQQLVSQEGFQRGRGLLNTLADRGLATSGLLQLGDVQNRMAQGATLSSLANANAQVQKAGMDASKDISDNLVNQLMQANTQRDASLLNADLTNYELRQGEQDKALQTLLSLVEVLGAEGMDNTTKNLITQAYQAYLDGDSEALRKLIGGGDGTTPTIEDTFKTTDERGDLTFKDILDWGRIGAYTGTGFAGGTAVAPGLGSLIGSIGGFGIGLTEQLTNKSVTLKTPDGSKVTYKNWDEALSAVKSMYKDFPNSDKIEIVKDGNKIKFVVNGQKFDTYNKANNYIKDFNVK
jgi:hypothetical protein